MVIVHFIPLYFKCESKYDVRKITNYLSSYNQIWFKQCLVYIKNIYIYYTYYNNNFNVFVVFIYLILSKSTLDKD